MPARPSNITGLQDILPTVNQLIRELQIRIDGLNKFKTPGQNLQATGTLNFGSVPANSVVERVVRVPGANQKGVAAVSPQLEPGTSLTWSAHVTAPNVVTVRLSNPTTSPITANTVVWNASVQQQ